MSLLRLIGVILFLALASAFILVSFYLLQRDFTTQYKEFTLTLSKLESKELQIKHDILQNALLSYQDLDSIAKHSNDLHTIYLEAIRSKILEDETYTKVKNKLFELEKTLQVKLEGIEDQLMLNVSIRNSLLFLSTQLHQLDLDSAQKMHVYAEANKILKRFNDTVLTQDLDYLSREHYRIASESKDPKLQQFIENFNLHSEYLIKNFPQFIISTKYILNNNLTLAIEDISSLFKDLAMKDFRTLDFLALILFSIFLAAVFVIIILTLKYFRENKKLLHTTHSLEYSLSHDQLTDLRNRQSFTQELSQLKNPHLLLINIDNFKNVNDIYGNPIGNHLIKALAKFISALLEDTPHIGVYRTGGDEFAILFDEISEQKALELAYEIQTNIAKKNFSFNHLDIAISVSIASNNLQPILENADLALKRVKKDLTRRVIAFKEELNLKKSVKENLKIVDLIKHAILEDRVLPFFQPIVNLQNSKIQKYEALVRIELKNGEILSPALFLDTLKKTSYYQEVTSIMMQKTIQVAKAYPQYRFSINISMIDILNAPLKNMLLRELRENFQTNSPIDIEILESEHIHDIDKVKEFITELHALGSQVLLDDFGSGYSNFSYFSDLEIDLVKIDGSIIKEIVENERKSHMLQSIFDFSQGLRLENVAEFVETKEIAQMLKKMGVKYAQGYYFAKPAAKPLDNENVDF